MIWIFPTPRLHLTNTLAQCIPSSLEQSPNNQPLAPELTLQARPKSALDGSSASRKSALAKEYGGCGGGDNNGVLSFKRSYSCRGFRKSELFHDVLYSIKYPARPSTPLENGGDVWPSRTHESSKLSDHHDQVVDEIGIDEIMELYAGRSTVPSRLYPSSSSISSDEHSSDDDSMSDFINLEHQLNPSDISSDEDDMQDISTYDSPDDIFRKNSKPVSFHIDPEPSDLHHLDSDDSDDDIDNNRKNNDNQQIPVSTTSSSTSSYMSLPPFENVRANPNSFIRPGSGFSPSDSKEEAEARYRRLVNGDRDYLPNPDFFEMIQDPDVVGLEERRGFVLFMQHLSEKYHISKETVYLALNFMDRVLSKVQVKELGPIGLTCFYIAQKLTEDENKIDMESLGYQAYFSQKAYVTPEDLEILEMVVLKHLDYRLHVTTPHAVLDELLLIIQYSGLINEEIRFKLFWGKLLMGFGVIS